MTLDLCPLSASGSGWGEQYGLDPFGNLTSKTVTSGSGPGLSVSVNANNQIEGVSGLSYDANGNELTSGVTYDVENHLNGGAPYVYDAQNRRLGNVTAGNYSCSNLSSFTLTMYSPVGQRLADYTFAPQYEDDGQNSYWWMQVTLNTSDQYFGGRRLATVDQLGSAGTYYPWGENKGTTDPLNTWSFATYWQDSATGLDYANNRYYSNQYGRFTTPDPYSNSGGWATLRAGIDTPTPEAIPSTASTQEGRMTAMLTSASPSGVT